MIEFKNLLLTVACGTYTLAAILLFLACATRKGLVARLKRLAHASDEFFRTLCLLSFVLILGICSENVTKGLEDVLFRWSGHRNGLLKTCYSEPLGRWFVLRDRVREGGRAVCKPSPLFVQLCEAEARIPERYLIGEPLQEICFRVRNSRFDYRFGLDGEVDSLLHRHADALFYLAKNRVFSHPVYASQVNEILLRGHFGRAVTLLSAFFSIAFVLLAIILGFRLAVDPERYGRAIRRSLVAAMVFVFVTLASGVGYAHTMQYYNRTIYGYFHSIALEEVRWADR